MAGSLDNSSGSNVKRNIKIVDITGIPASTIESTYNTNYGLIGWRIIQVFTVATKTYILAEKEI